jgi:Protein of unknown function (DUF1552)
MTTANKLRPSRRQFLTGAAGFTLGLPFLESLMGKDANAGLPPYAANPRFVAMTTQHGGIWGSNMWPGDEMLSQSLNLYSGHTGQYGDLVPNVNGGSASLSPVLTGDSSRLTAALAAKMNCLRGLDVPHYLSHNTGGELGNFAAEGDYIDPMGPVQELRRTIDQVMAYSPSFYPDIANIRLRSMHIGTHSHHSWSYANPDNPVQGAVVPMPLSQSAIALFNQIFVEEEVDPNPRPLVVDRVIEHYRQMRQGAFGDASRLSSADGRRLDDHMDRLYDLQTRLNAVASCGDVIPLGNDTTNLDVGGYSNNVADMISYYQLYNDVIVAAFICGTSRIAMINSGETWSDQYPGLCCDWHQLVAHEAHNPQGVGADYAQPLMVAAKRTFFENVFLDLANKLDVEESDGITYLDNSLMFWTQESGSTTHNAISMPVVTAGSAAGTLQTGKYVDYRNRNNTSLQNNYSPEHMAQRPGLPYQRFLGNVLTAAGVPSQEWERPGEHGYGDNVITFDAQAMPQQYMDDASNPLPHFLG